MTVSTTTSEASFIGNGSTTVFSLGFEIESATNLIAHLVLTTGQIVALVLNVDYTVSGVGQEAGATLTMTTAPAAGQRLNVRRLTSRTQPVTLLPSAGFSPRAIEDALDRVTLLIQEISKIAERAIKVPVGENTDELPRAEDRSNKVLAFDSDGNVILFEVPNFGPLSPIIVFNLNQKLKLTGGNGGFISQLIQMHPVEKVDRPAVTWYDIEGVMQAAIMWHEDDLTSGLTQNSWDLKTKGSDSNMITRLTVDSKLDKANMTLNELRSINHRYNGEDVWRSRPETEGNSIRLAPNAGEVVTSYVGFSGDRIVIGYNGGDGYIATASGKEFKLFVNAKILTDKWSMLVNDTEFLVDDINIFFVRRKDGTYIFRTVDNELQIFNGANVSSKLSLSGRAELGYDLTSGAAYVRATTDKNVRLYSSDATGDNWTAEAAATRFRIKGLFDQAVVNVSNLPAANTVPGHRAMVTLHDQASPTFNATVATGANTDPLPVFSNGSVWKVG